MPSPLPPPHHHHGIVYCFFLLSHMHACKGLLLTWNTHTLICVRICVAVAVAVCVHSCVYLFSSIIHVSNAYWYAHTDMLINQCSCSKRLIFTMRAPNNKFIPLFRIHWVCVGCSLSYDPLRSFSSLHTFYTYIYIVEALLYYTYTPHTA